MPQARRVEPTCDVGGEPVWGESPPRKQITPKRDWGRCRRRAETSQLGGRKASPFRAWRAGQRHGGGPRVERDAAGEARRGEARRGESSRARLGCRWQARFGRSAGPQADFAQARSGAVPSGEPNHQQVNLPGSAQASRSAPGAGAGRSRRCPQASRIANRSTGPDRPRPRDRRSAPSQAIRGNAARRAESPPGRPGRNGPGPVTGA